MGGQVEKGLEVYERWEKKGPGFSGRWEEGGTGKKQHCVIFYNQKRARN